MGARSRHVDVREKHELVAYCMLPIGDRTHTLFGVLGDNALTNQAKAAKAPRLVFSLEGVLKQIPGIIYLKVVHIHLQRLFMSAYWCRSSLQFPCQLIISFVYT